MSGRERQTDTRQRIQQVALELFVERGYEKTALREIAERLGVTKAALYYHFKTKEDIVFSIFEDGAAALDRLIAWAQEQPRTQETRLEIVRRFAAMMGRQRTVMRFLQENQPALRELQVGELMRARLTALSDLLSDESMPLADQIRARLALFSTQMSMITLGNRDIPDDELNAAALEVALDLMRR
ncbi:MAG: helix-turn-helix domain-containing protein [Actinocatenispora sp.]